MTACRRVSGLVLWAVTFLLPATSFAQTTYFPARGVFNGFLGQVNIVECDNGNGSPVSVKLTLRAATGEMLGAVLNNISGFGSNHTILNDLGDIVDRTGTYSLELLAGQEFLGDKLNCRTAFYRPGSNGKQFEYAYVLPVQNPQFGVLGGMYNSIDPAGAGRVTSNWLSIINYDTTPLTAVVEVYRANGTLAKKLPVNGLTSGARVDLPLGHPEGEQSGTYRIRPSNLAQRYDAFMVRYNAASASRFNYAFPVRALQGSCGGEPLLASTMGNGLTDNWLEVANLNPTQINVRFEVRNGNGQVLHQETKPVAANGTTSLYLSGIIDGARTGNVGTARVLCDDPSDRLAVQSTFYGHLPGNGNVEWAYSTQSRGALSVGVGSQLSIPVNTYVGMSNWLKLIDGSLKPTAVNFTLFNSAGGVKAAGQNSLPGGGSADIGIHAMSGANFIGSMISSSKTGTADFNGEVLRVMARGDGQIGTIVQIPGVVQQQGLAGEEQAGFFGDPQSLTKYRNKITRAEARHLYTRAAFGGNKPQIDYAVSQGLTKTINKLTTFIATPGLDAEAFKWTDGSYETTIPNDYRLDGIRDWWLTHMVKTPNPLKEKMAFIWHDLLATSCRVVGNNEEVKCYEHIQMLRKHALGNFRQLMQELTVDYVMLKWLNGGKNVKESPDENYSRETWELFTLGEKSKHEGRYPLYNELDVHDAARAYTGWSTQVINNVPQVLFIPGNHDYGDKTIWRGTPYEKTGNFDHEDMINMTLDVRPESAQWIAKRLFSAFIHDHPSPAVVNQLAELIKKNGWNVKLAVQTLLQSEAMFSRDARNSRIKDPLTYAVGMLRQTDIPVWIDSLRQYTRDMGMEVGNPGSVNGWVINKYKKASESEYFLAWLQQYDNFSVSLMQGLWRYPTYSLRALLPSATPTSSEVVDHLASLFDVSLSASERSAYIKYMDNELDYQGAEVPDLFDARVDWHVRKKVAGVLWMIAQHEDYMTF